ncbi:TPA: glycosyltransferase [Vibrio parahaemolyticus]|nr:glycosyltransferase [Vibrio parahaemolyticus]
MRKNILVVIGSFNGGGAERVGISIANEYANIANVFIYALNPEGVYKNEVENSIKIISDKKRKASLSILHLSKALNTLDIDEVFVSQSHLVGLCLIAKKLTFNSKKIKVVGREASIPSANMLDVKGFKRYILKYLTRISYSNVDLLIAPTLEIKKDLVKYYNLSRDILVIPNPIDKDKIIELSHKPVDDWFSNLQGKKIIAIGRLIPLKGFENLIIAFSRLKERNISLTILGEGPDKEKLISVANKHNVQDRVFLPGFINNPFPYIKNSDLFVLSSFYEGMPNGLIQASVLGIKVVATNSEGGVRDMIKNKHLVPINDVPLLAQAIDDKLNDNPCNIFKNNMLLEPREFINKLNLSLKD